MYERATFSLKSLSLFSRRSVTPCPSSTPSCCGTTRTCSRSRPTRSPSWWTRRSCAEHRLQLICSWAEARPRFTCLLFTLYNQTTNKLFIARFSFSSHQCGSGTRNLRIIRDSLKARTPCCAARWRRWSSSRRTPWSTPRCRWWSLWEGPSPAPSSRTPPRPTTAIYRVPCPGIVPRVHLPRNPIDA